MGLGMIEVPELGPSLGRAGEPPGGGRLDDIRLRMVTGVFELAGAGRSFATAGDPAGAMGSLSRTALLGLWEGAVAGAADRITRTVNGSLRAAREESRYPPGKLDELLLTPDDTRAVGARLGSGGAGFVAALDALEQTTRGAPWSEWSNALTAAARRLEAAWLALEENAAVEERHWEVEVERVRAWRRPRWPLWLVTILVFACATWLGLILGGYIPAPAMLRGFAEWWWEVP